MLILFDIDGTLVDHALAERLAVVQLHKRLQLPGSSQAFADRWASVMDGHFARYAAGNRSYQGHLRDHMRGVFGPLPTDEVVDGMILEYLRDYERHWSLFSDVMPCLERLSSHRLGVISNGQSDVQLRKLLATKIKDKFEHIVISSDHDCAKPSPRIFHVACCLFKESRRNCLYVGDRYDFDAIASRAAGFHGVWLDRNAQMSDDHAPPIIHSLDELTPALVA